MSDPTPPPPASDPPQSDPAPEPVIAADPVGELADEGTGEEAEATPPQPEEPNRLAEALEEVTITEPEKTQVTESAKEDEINRKQKSFIQPAVSFKEESNLVCDLSDFERKSLDQLKHLVHESILNKTLVPKGEASSSKSADEQQVDTAVATTIESALQEEDQLIPTGEVTIWGVPLLQDERTEMVLLKFLRARDFRVNESFAMLKNTLKWREEFGIEKLVEEELGDDLEKVVFMHGHDREGHPICYNVYGEFQNKELYAKTFCSEEKRDKFLRWRIQNLEKSIRMLDFKPGGVNTIFQVNDLKNAPGPGKRELRQATRRGLQLLQDNYPEFVAKQVFINVPWWYVAFYTMMSPFMTQRTKSKFVFAGPPKTAETLFKYISPEQVPIQYGGLSVDYCDCNPEFTVDDPATDIFLKPTTKQFVEIICSEKCIIVWELRVVGWEVTYSAEFVPSNKDGYTVIIQKATKMTPHDDPVVSGSFKVSDLGKIVLTVDNPTFKRRKLLYRYKVLPYSD